MQLRDATSEDAPAVLALNQSFVTVLSPLDRQRLAHLAGQAAVYRVVEREGQILAFLLAMREGADYDSPNYRWFAVRHHCFLYIDRVVVAAQAQGAGLGELLYRDAHAHARAGQVPSLACEFDIVPPNPASERFHARLGFREVGRQTLDGGKQVSLQMLDVGSATALSRG